MRDYYLGHNLTPNAPIETWARESELDWTVNESPVYYRAGDNAAISKDHKLLYKSTDPELIFGVVGSQFHPVQPLELLGFYKALEQETGFSPKAGGVLKNRRIFITAKNDRQYEVGGHPVKNYLVGSTENGGTSATVISPTNIRPICENTLQMAISEALKMSITHRTKINWIKVKKWVTQENESFDLYGELMQSLFKTPVDTDGVKNFAKEVLAPNWDTNDKDQKAPRAYTNFAPVLVNGTGQNQALNDGQPNAYWLLNGFTRYFDHEKPARSEENRADNALFGTGVTVKNQILNKLIKDCAEKWNNREPVAIKKELKKVAKQAVYA